MANLDIAIIFILGLLVLTEELGDVFVGLKVFILELL